MIDCYVSNGAQAGLSFKVLEVLRKGGFDKPLPIQAQALPVIMSGRDCIGIAKTGSGKTLAFVLPLLRHVKDQPPLAQVRLCACVRVLMLCTVYCRVLT